MRSCLKCIDHARIKLKNKKLIRKYNIFTKKYNFISLSLSFVYISYVYFKHFIISNFFLAYNAKLKKHIKAFLPLPKTKHTTLLYTLEF